MSERTSIVLPREVVERHNDRRKDLDLTWEEYLDGQAPDADVLTADDVLSEEDIRHIVREEVREALAEVVEARGPR